MSVSLFIRRVLGTTILSIASSSHSEQTNQWESMKISREIEKIDEAKKYDLRLQTYNERITRNVTDRLNPVSQTTLFIESNFGRRMYSEVINDHMKSVAERALTQTLQITFVDDNEFVTGARGWAEGRLEIIHDALSRRPEKNVLNDPLNITKEGIPGKELEEPGRLKSKFSYGIRPFSTNPYLYTTWKNGSSSVGVRVHHDDVTFSADHVYSPSLVFSAGARARPFDTESPIGFLGFTRNGKSTLFGGVTFSGDYPNGVGVIASYSRHF